MAANTLEEVSQKIIDAITDCIVITDNKKVIIDANDALFPMFGYRPDEVKGASVLDLTEDTEDARIAELYVKMLLSTDADDLRIGRTKCVRKDKKVFVCDLSITEVQANDGTSTFVLVFHDTSEAEVASEALKAQKALVDKALGEADNLRKQAEGANRQLEAQKTQLQKALQEAEQLRLADAASKKQIEEINRQLQAQKAAVEGDLKIEQEARLKQQQAGTQSRFATYMIVMVCVFFLAPYLAGLLKVPESVIEIAKQATPLALGTLGIIAGALFNAQSQQQAMQRQNGVSSGLYNIQPAQNGMLQQPGQYGAPTGYGAPGGQPGMNQPTGYGAPPTMAQPQTQAGRPPTAPPPGRPPVAGGRG